MGPDDRIDMKGKVKTVSARNTPLLKDRKKKRLAIIIFTKEL